jgi:2,4-dienoyl-CoA reductase (NADPH2)
LGITCLTSSSLIEITADSVKVRNAKGEEVYIAADTVIQADGAIPAHPMFHEFEWMIDELHGVGDALIPRGLEQAIQEGFRLGVRL